MIRATGHCRSSERMLTTMTRAMRGRREGPETTKEKVAHEKGAAGKERKTAWRATGHP